MRRRKAWTWPALLLSLMLMVTACGGGSSESGTGGSGAGEADGGGTEQQPPLKIGVLTDQSGALKNYGLQQVRGLELGLEYATDGTMTVLGRKIELVVEDDASDPEQGVQKVRKLLEQDQVDILQGTASSGVAQAIIPEVERAQKILVVDPAAATEITGANCSRYVFRTGRNVAQDALTGAAYLVKEGRSRFMNLAPDYAFGHSSADAWSAVIEGAGGEVIDNVFAPLDTRDFTPYLQRILQAEPDGVVVTWAGAGAVTLFQQIAEMGLYDKMLVFTGIGDIPSLKATGDAGVGLVGINTYFHLLPDNEINDWLVERHQEKYGEPPDLFTAGGMAAGIAIVRALEEAGSTEPEALIEALESMSFQGPKGTYTIRAEDHQALQPMYVVRLERMEGYDYPVPVLVEELAPEETAPPDTCSAF